MLIVLQLIVVFTVWNFDFSQKNNNAENHLYWNDVSFSSSSVGFCQLVFSNISALLAVSKSYCHCSWFGLLYPRKLLTTL